MSVHTGSVVQLIPVLWYRCQYYYSILWIILLLLSFSDCARSLRTSRRRLYYTVKHFLTLRLQTEVRQNEFAPCEFICASIFSSSYHRLWFRRFHRHRLCVQGAFVDCVSNNVRLLQFTLFDRLLSLLLLAVQCLRSSVCVCVCKSGQIPDYPRSVSVFSFFTKHSQYFFSENLILLGDFNWSLLSPTNRVALCKHTQPWFFLFFSFHPLELALI